ncbi:uncharacterized protein LOC136091369 [Hydra vulgaris]|uniref:Uncharacterized protein LOC136091369 n=1 Tax=Hydra vulgaris TaxID=6087 RepID=A0ABM4DK51_HYDVU
MSLERNHAIAAIVLGGIESAIGLIVSIASFVMAGKASLSLSLTPYWAGLIFLIPGILGLVSGFTKNRCCMIAFMVLNIICFIIESVSAILLGLVVTFWKIASNTLNCRYSKVESTCYCQGTPVTGVESCDVLSTISSILTFVLVSVIIATIIALAASILGCAAVCCSSPPNNGAIVMGGTSNTLPEKGNQPPPYIHS